MHLSCTTAQEFRYSAARVLMSIKKSNGFTLIELMVSLAVVLILVGLGVPSFVSAMKNSQLSSDFSDLTRSLYLARSEAVKRTSRVAVCARADDTTCGADWNQGWIIFVDNDQGEANTTGIINATDEILRFTPPLDNKRKVQAYGSPSHAVSSSSNSVIQSYIQYRTDGASSLSGGTFVMCDDRGANYARSVNIMLTGDIRQGRKKGGNTLQDVNGVAIVCPNI